MKHKITNSGKAVYVNGRLWSDCESEEKARVTAKALENYFRKGA